VDYFRFTVFNAGDFGIFDIDFGWTSANSVAPGDFDAWIELYDANGAFITFDDDLFPADSGSTDLGGFTLDSLLQFTFPAPGVYYLAVGGFPSLEPVPNGGTYTLQISIQNHPVS
jgi:hypothetical protein